MEFSAKDKGRGLRIRGVAGFVITSLLSSFCVPDSESFSNKWIEIGYRTFKSVRFSDFLHSELYRTT